MVLAMSEGVQGIRVTKTFGAEAQELERFRRRNRAVRDQQEQIFRRVSRFAPTVSFVTGHQHRDPARLRRRAGGARRADAGQLVVFAGLLQQFSTQITGMATIVNTLQQSLIGARRVFEVLDAPVEVESPREPGAARAGAAAPSASRRSASPTRARLVLDGVDFAVEPGRCVAFVGRDRRRQEHAARPGAALLRSRARAGPRSTASTCARWTWTSCAATSASCSRRACCFAAPSRTTSRSGIPTPRREAIERAARTAGAHAFIAELPRGYDTSIEEAGHNLSGGQRQRLAIARAILLEPPILLLDDPTSAIDVHTEDEVLSAIEAARHGRTTLLVTSRFSALRAADEIFVLDAGRIVERGTHAALAGRGRPVRARGGAARPGGDDA